MPIGAGSPPIPPPPSPAELFWPSFNFRVGFEARVGDPTSSIAWTDLSPHVRSGSIKMGRNAELDRWEPRRATITLNSYDVVNEVADALDPLNPDGPYYGRIRALCRVGLSVGWAGTVYPLFTDFLRTWSHQRPELDEKVVDLECVDVGTALNRMDSPETAWAMEVARARPRHWWRLGTGQTIPDSGSGAATAETRFVTDGGRLAAGDSGSSGSFDGENSVAYVGSGAGLSTPWTIETSFRTGLGATFKTLYYQAGGIGISMYGNDAPSNIGRLAASTVNGPTVSWAVGSRDVTDGAPHHLALTFDGSNLRLYIDGELDAHTAGAVVPWPGGPTFIGGINGNVDDPHMWHGSIGDGVVYNTALSAFLVALRYNAWKTGYAGDTPRTRAQRILNFAGLPGADQVLDVGTCRLGPMELGEELLAHVYDVADAEGGAFYTDGAGRYVLRGREYLITNPRATTPQVTFSDIAGTGVAYDLPLSTDVTDATLWNRAVVTRKGGAAQTAEDSIAQARDGIRTVARSGLLYESDHEARSAAHRILRRASLPTRVGTITIYPMRDPDALYPAALGREPFDRVAFAHKPGTTTFTEDFHVQGIEHTFSSDPLSWKTVLRVTRADPTDPASIMRADTGLLDEGLVY